uniref:Sulfotransferase n=1 Tax=Oryza punctata TaxID=4537 RepID=A0A0E0LA17_ORYPU
MYELGPVPFRDIDVDGNQATVFPEQPPEELADLAEMVSSLPSKMEVHPPVRIFSYQGVWLMENWILAAVALQHRFVHRPDDVIVASLPKCGTTWLNALAFATMARHTHPLTTASHPPPSQPAPVPPFSRGPLHEQQGGHARHTPVPAPHEHAHAARHVAERHHRRPPRLRDNVLFLRYEDLLHDPAGNVRKLARFIGLPQPVHGLGSNRSTRLPFSKAEEEAGVVDSIDELCSLNNMRNIEANKTGYMDPRVKIPRDALFRKGMIGDWANYMTPDMARRSHLSYWYASTEISDNVLFLRYEELLRDLAGNVQELARFIRLRSPKAEEEAGIVEAIVELCSLDNTRGFEANKTGYIVAQRKIPRETLFWKGMIE